MPRKHKRKTTRNTNLDALDKAAKLVEREKKSVKSAAALQGRSKEKPWLMIMNNQKTHSSLAAIDIARASGVVILTLPPHTSHKMQPLDRSIYGSMKDYFNKECDSWMKTNPGRRVTISGFQTSVKEENYAIQRKKARD
ncbi:hypothetical protein EB796_025131 [Bugula neritina]|uniref:DDE-1 domain-containing protein n=1 Tax=Bugula neritina TaxID=10212 RepID=A0A7J7IT32_BUGNE|nr:hypothetical protein EB796_025131 [Bugula neritina]